MFIAVDGPNASGKTTICRELHQAISAKGRPCILTREPSDSAVGTFARDAQEVMCGKAYACLIASDRHEHIRRVIQPAIAESSSVISDRYVASSLALQALDGVNEEYIWAINQGFIVPDKYVFLDACSSVLEERLAARPTLSRFERDYSSSQEREAFQEVGNLLRQRGIDVKFFRTDLAPPSRIVAEVVAWVSEVGV